MIMFFSIEKNQDTWHNVFRCPDSEKSAYYACDKQPYKPKSYHDERIDAEQYQSNNNEDCKHTSFRYDIFLILIHNAIEIWGNTHFQSVSHVWI